MLITQEGMIIRINVSGVRVVGRSTQGVKLMNLSAEDRLVSIAKVEREEEALVEGEGGDGATLLGAGEIEPELELEAVDDLGGLDDLDSGLDELTDLEDDDDMTMAAARAGRTKRCTEQDEEGSPSSSRRPQPTQFSVRNPGTRSNSPRLLVTRVRSSASA